MVKPCIFQTLTPLIEVIFPNDGAIQESKSLILKCMQTTELSNVINNLELHNFQKILR